MTITKEQIIDDSKKTIETTNISFNYDKANKFLIEGQRKYNRTITSKQINPIIMCKILDFYSKNFSISKISQKLNISRKAVKTNLEKSKSRSLSYVIWKRTKWYKVKYLKIEYSYSLKKWSMNWLMNSANKSFAWTKKSNENYKEFIDWFKTFKNPLDQKLSADIVLYYWNKHQKLNDLNSVKKPTKQTIYNWIEAKKFNFNKRSFIKLSNGLYGRKQKNITRREYKDQSKSILEFKNDTEHTGIKNAYEIDLVKGSIKDQYSILTCLHKQTRKLYAKIVKPNAHDVKLNLKKIINENNLNIHQLIIDNGSENVLLHEINEIKQIYRCRPYCSSDKGQIENVHRLLRYWIKKGKSIDSISQDELDQIVNKINNYPRRIYENGKLMSANEFCGLS